MRSMSCWLGHTAIRAKDNSRCLPAARLLLTGEVVATGESCLKGDLGRVNSPTSLRFFWIVRASLWWDSTMGRTYHYVAAIATQGRSSLNSGRNWCWNVIVFLTDTCRPASPTIVAFGGCVRKDATDLASPALPAALSAFANFSPLDRGFLYLGARTSWHFEKMDAT